MVEIDLPRGWKEWDGVARAGQHPIAENSHGTIVGVKEGASGSWSVWVGTGFEPSEQKTVASILESRSAATIKALDFMQQHPRANVENQGGFVRVLDRRGDVINSV